MRNRCSAMLFALVTPAIANAQTTTADGVQALIRGDYQTAARILRPLAEETERPDPLAQFFLAMLYHTGQGVQMNSTRACGLYLRAAASNSPFQNQALALAQTIHQDNPILREECSAASVRPWRDPPAASFRLGADHWLQIDAAGFVVGFNGEQKRANVPLGGPDWVFFPIRYTPLDVSRPVAMRRHFIEFAVWMPYTRSDQIAWNLFWSVYEIRGLEAVHVLGETVRRWMTAGRPDASSPFDDIARLRTNADGEAEWVVLGANARSGIIPPPEPR